MNENTQRNIEYAEEIARDAAAGDIGLAEDISAFVMWITALSTGGIALAISQSKNIVGINSCYKTYLIGAVICLSIAVLSGVLARIQAQKTIQNHRTMIFLKKGQKLVFYENECIENPIEFGRLYHECEFLGEDIQMKFKKLRTNNHRWYSEEKVRWIQIFFFVVGYTGLFVLTIV
jgi:hypothetical protein